MGVPAWVASQGTLLASLDEEWRIRLLALILGFVLILVAIGPARVQAWANSLSEWWHSSARQIERLQNDKATLEDELAEAKRELRQLEHEKDMLRAALTPTEADVKSAVVAEVVREGPVFFPQVVLAPKATVVWSGPRGPAPDHYPVPYTNGAPATTFKVEGPEDTYEVALAYEVRGYGGSPDPAQSDSLRSTWTIQTTTHIQVLDEGGNQVRYPAVCVGRASASEDGSVRYGVSGVGILSGLREGVYTINVFDHAEGTGAVNESDYASVIGSREYRNMRLTVTKLGRVDTS